MTKIFAVVVTYNPDLDELIKNIESIKDQVSQVIICNNSTIDISLNDARVVEFNFGDNLGIAKAQSIGMEWAFNNGADYVLQMDQDSRPQSDMVAKLLSLFYDLQKNKIKIGLVGPTVFDEFIGESNKSLIRQVHSIGQNKFIYVPSTLSSGSLISYDAYQAVGGMNDELFIDVVDFEYCWRLQAQGFVIVRCVNALLFHRQGEGRKRILGFVTVGIPSPVRHYYAFRNTIFLLSSSHAPFYWKTSSVVKLIFKYFLYRFIFEDGLERYKFMVLGIKDGMKRRMGRIND